MATFARAGGLGSPFAKVPLYVPRAVGDTENDEPLGNFPQALTHLAHISAAVAMP